MEWLQIKDRDFSYSRPNTICSFLHEKEDSDESAQAPDKLAEESEGEVSDKGNSDTNCDQAQDKLAEESEGEASDRGNSDTNCDLEKQHGLETDASSLPLPQSPASEAEGSPSASVALEDAPPWCQLSSLQDFFMELNGPAFKDQTYRLWHDFQFIWALAVGKTAMFLCIPFVFGVEWGGV